MLAGLQGVVSGLFLMIVYFGFMLTSQGRIAPKVRNIAATSDPAQAIKAGMGRVANDTETYVWGADSDGFDVGCRIRPHYAGRRAGQRAFLDDRPVPALLHCHRGRDCGIASTGALRALQFPTLWQAGVVFGGIQVAAFVVGNLIYPRMQAQTQNVDPVATILALSFLGFLWEFQAHSWQYRLR